MDSEHGNVARKTVECDRLSILPNDLIHKILSFVDIKDAINTSILSSRWRFIWTTMPYLNFSSESFSTSPKFSEFVTHVLFRRNNKIELSSVKLNFCEMVGEIFLKLVLDYAFSHNVQQVTFSCLFKDEYVFPLHLFSSQSLKYLRLIGSTGAYSSFYNPEYSSTLASTWNLPSLTTLQLDYIAFSDEDTAGLFSKCANLKHLTLNHFRMVKSGGFCICHPRLSSLTLENGHLSLKAVNVVAPQLKNLSIIECYGQYRVSAPDLVSLLFKSYRPLQFSEDDMLYLEKVHVCIYYPTSSDTHELFGLLQQLHNVKFLTLNSELVELLSSSMELISLQPSRFVNLKSLTIYPEIEYMDGQEEEKMNISTEVKNYLLDGSPSATFRMVSHEFSTDDMLCLEKVHICIYYPTSSGTRELVGLLQQLHRVKFLTLNSELIELLSSSMELISLQPSPFVSLKSLTIYPEKEIRGYRNGVSTQKLIANLWAILEEEKTYSETDTSNMDRKKEPMEIHEAKMHEQNAKLGNQKAQPVEKMQLHIHGMMTRIKGYWDDLGVQIDKGRSKTCDIISRLREIEELLPAVLPTSKRDKLQERFFSLRAEADTVVKKIIARMKTQSDEKHNLLNDCFNELATTS